MNQIKRFCSEEDAIGIVEIILILVIIIGLVIIFKDKIQEIVNDAFNEITSSSKKIIK